jgi:asparagine N-glycosylation enzyme membrane subunit Stt3
LLKRITYSLIFFLLFFYLIFFWQLLRFFLIITSVSLCFLLLDNKSSVKSL